MSDRLLKRHEIAALFGTGPNKAAIILAENGVQPVDVGRGKTKRLRWLESAVQSVILALHAKAQPKPKASRLCRSTIPGLDKPLGKCSPNEVIALIKKQNKAQPLTECGIVQ